MSERLCTVKRAPGLGTEPALLDSLSVNKLQMAECGGFSTTLEKTDKGNGGWRRAPQGEGVAKRS
eukprot:12895117-Prorocentrum_lima.AAC.1